MFDLRTRRQGIHPVIALRFPPPTPLADHDSETLRLLELMSLNRAPGFMGGVTKADRHLTFRRSRDEEPAEPSLIANWRIPCRRVPMAARRSGARGCLPLGLLTVGGVRGGAAFIRHAPYRIGSWFSGRDRFRRQTPQARERPPSACSRWRVPDVAESLLAPWRGLHDRENSAA